MCDGGSMRSSEPHIQALERGGVGGLTWRAYDADFERNLENLHGRPHRGSVSAAAVTAGLHSKAG